MFDEKERILVTGGAGFIGSAVLRLLFQTTGAFLINLDKLTYAGDLASLQTIAGSERYVFEQADICDAQAVERIFAQYRPTKVMHLAAESHVDRSIDGPSAFIQTNVFGTFTLLDQAKRYWSELSADEKAAFRFHHISTDEVYGSLGKDGFFREDTPYDPRSPYSASKAGSDHLVSAWFHTYGLPTVITNCSNNYGPYQFPEKLIPVMISNGLAGNPLPVYGKGENVRDWLFVEDHAQALVTVLEHGRLGETYNIGGASESSNLALTEKLCDILDQVSPLPIGNRRALITFVTDRPGHDFRYAIDFSKIERELGWHPAQTLESGLTQTVKWYIDNLEWLERLRKRSGASNRLGLATSAPAGTQS